MWVRQNQMGDPAKIAERKDTQRPKTCVGCVHLHVREDVFTGRRIVTCDLGLPVGDRCGRYEVKP